MATREERMQQRLRGAQRRQVRDVDFGLSFPVVPAPAPAPEQVPVQTAISDPIDVQPEEPIQITEHQSQPHDEQEGLLAEQFREAHTPPPVVHLVNDANTSAKRRKLDTDVVSSSGRSTHSSRTAPPPDIYDLDLNEDIHVITQDVSVDNEGHSIVSDDAVSERNTSPSAPAIRTPVSATRHAIGSVERIQDGADVEHNLTAMSGALSSIVGLNSGLPSAIQDHDLEEETVQEPESPLLQKRKRDRQNSIRQSAIQQPAEMESEDAAESSGMSTESSILQEQPGLNQGSPDVGASGPETDEPSAELEDDEDKEDEAEEIGDTEAAFVLQRSKGRRVSAGVAIQAPSQSSPEPPRQPVRTEAPRAKKRKKPSSTQQRNPKRRKSQEDNTESQPRTKLRSTGPIPVTVHRLTDGVIYDEEESDAEILNAEIPYAKRGGVNSIDVLSQICQEIIQSGLNTLAEGGVNTEDPVLRQEYRTKWQAVDAFSRELQSRLLEHTINLDNTRVLEKRIRDEQKRKLSLREEILKIRAEREQVALKMDEIRIKHEANTITAQETDILNSRIYDIELALERGKAKYPVNNMNSVMDMTGTELLLKRLAQDVSCKSSNGGILKQVKEFNAFLERAAFALEARRK
ncbi:hypothetical protein F5884DRAFT_776585 [Xylogone sp. PMI_703]|nr:hypothetical protein F5884DRAFT_776585 [Xylogone sp. PMI_703]